MMRALVVAAVDQEAMKTRGSHFTELDFLLARAGEGGHASMILQISEGVKASFIADQDGLDEQVPFRKLVAKAWGC
jgi:hypothetical protein